MQFLFNQPSLLELLPAGLRWSSKTELLRITVHNNTQVKLTTVLYTRLTANSICLKPLFRVKIKSLRRILVYHFNMEPRLK